MKSPSLAEYVSCLAEILTEFIFQITAPGVGRDGGWETDRIYADIFIGASPSGAISSFIMVS